MTDTWNSESLFEYFSQQIANQQREHDKFERTVREGFIKQNEFRAALEDLGKTMATRRELESAVEALQTRREDLVKQNNERLDEMSAQIASLRSRLDVGNPAIQELQIREAKSLGIQRGSAITIGQIYAAIAAIGVIVSIVILLIHRTK